MSPSGEKGVLVLIMFSLRWETTVGRFFSLLFLHGEGERDKLHRVSYGMQKHLFAIKTFSAFGKHCGQNSLGNEDREDI